MSKFVITGATSMIGIALTQYALENGDKVIAFVRAGSPRTKLLPVHKNLEMCECDLNDYTGFIPPGKADVFVHLAWEKTTAEGRDDAGTQFKNVQYALEAVRMAAAYGCGCFIGAGSQAEYGTVQTPLNGNMPVSPESAYGIAKYCAGKLTRILCGQQNIRHCWARILSVYGENDGSNTLISYLIQTLTNGEIPSLTPCGQVWDYLHCSDAARALYAIAKSGADGKIYCLGSGNARMLKDYIYDVRDCVAPQAKLNFGAKEYYPHQPMFLTADITDLTNDTGFTPIMDFKEGIRKQMKAQIKKEGI